MFHCYPVACLLHIIHFVFVCSFVRLVFCIRTEVKVVSEISFACRDRASK